MLPKNRAYPCVDSFFCSKGCKVKFKKLMVTANYDNSRRSDWLHLPPGAAFTSSYCDDPEKRFLPVLFETK